MGMAQLRAVGRTVRFGLLRRRQNWRGCLSRTRCMNRPFCGCTQRGRGRLVLPPTGGALPLPPTSGACLILSEMSRPSLKGVFLPPESLHPPSLHSLPISLSYTSHRGKKPLSITTVAGGKLLPFCALWACSRQKEF